MIRIAHFGSYGVNVGDNIALLNIRKGIEQALGEEITWKSVCISRFHNSPKGMNNIEYIKHAFSQISEQNDMLIIGGGGLIESNNRSDNETRWKLPFTEETLSELRIPIVCFSVEEVYSIAEIIRREKGGAAIVTGGLSPKTRNSQVNIYQSG